MAAPGRLSASLAAAGRLLEGRRCLVALSGGPDSAVAAWLAAAHGASVRAIHVHHGWPSSDVMADAAETVARHLQIPLEIVHVEPPAGPSPEGQARMVRYRALLEAAAPDEVIVVGHTLDDQAETVLFNVARGSGTRGLSGIPRRRGAIVRPLLEVSRGEIEDLVNSERLPAVADPANADLALTRNRLRALMPSLEEAVGAKVIAGLARSGRIGTESDAVLAGLAARVPLISKGQVFCLPLAVLKSVSRPVQRVAVLEALRLIRPYGGTAAELERIADLVDGEQSVTELAGGFVAAVSSTMLMLGPAPHEAPAPVHWPRELGLIQWGNWSLSARLVEGRPAVLARGSRSAAFDPLVLDQGPLIVRSTRPGDLIAIGSGHKPVGDAVSEGGVAQLARRSYPVVAAGETVVWVPGVRRAALGWVSDDSARYLLLEIIEEGAWISERC